MSNLRYVSLFELYVHTIIQADDLMSPLSEAVRFFAQTSVLCKAETNMQVGRAFLETFAQAARLCVKRHQVKEREGAHKATPLHERASARYSATSWTSSWSSSCPSWPSSQPSSRLCPSWPSSWTSSWASCQPPRGRGPRLPHRPRP